MQGMFIHLKEAWYADASLKHRLDTVVDEVWIEVYDGNIRRGTINLAWHQRALREQHDCSPRLEVFDDQWRVFPYCDELFKALAHYGESKIASPDRICGMLKELGLKDATPRCVPNCAADVNSA